MKPLWVIAPEGRRIPAVHNRLVEHVENRSLDNEKDGNGAVRHLCVPGFSNRPRGYARRASRLGNARKVEGAAGVEPAFSR
jgi:hypothetical protein